VGKPNYNQLEVKRGKRGYMSPLSVQIGYARKQVWETFWGNGGHQGVSVEFLKRGACGWRGLKQRRRGERPSGKVPGEPHLEVNYQKKKTEF